MAKVLQTKPRFTKTELNSPECLKQWRHWLHWAQSEVLEKKLKTETLRWARENKGTSVTKDLDQLPDYEFAVIGKYLYALNSGAELPDKYGSLWKYVDQVIEKSQSIVAVEEDSKPKVKKPSAEQIAQKQVEQISGEIDNVIDGMIIDTTLLDPKHDFVTILAPHDPKAKALEMLIAVYSEELANVNNAIEADSDYELIGDNFTRMNAKRLAKVYDKLLTDVRYLYSKQVTPKDPAQLIKSLKVRPGWSEIGVKSADLKTLIGSKEVWVFDTRLNKLGVYYAEDANGLSVKGSSLISYSTESRSKRVDLKDYKKKMSGVTDAKELKKYYKGVDKLDARMNGKLTRETLILSIV